MQVIVPSKSIPIDHPIRQMARFVDANEWRLQHSTETEISVEIPGKWSDYCLTFTWQDSYAALHVNAFMDIFIVDQQIASAREVITEINSQIWLGHFRHNLPLRGTGGATPEQIEDLVDITLGECERAYPALFQIATGVVSPQTAVDTVLMETVGSA
jgi:hypothetical protein